MESKEQNESQSQKLSERIDTNVKIIIAFFLGAILAGTLVQFALSVLSEHISELLIGFIAVIGIFAIIALLFTTFKEFFFKLFFGISKADLEEVKQSSQSMVENATNLNWTAAGKDFKIVSQKGSVWYAWLSYRRWVVTVFYTLFLAFAGLLGSVLLYNQNQLLEKQNEKIDSQNKKIDSQIQLEEYSRRGNLIVMMSNIMDKADEEIRRAEENGDSSRALSQLLIGRIAALSQAFRPYRFLQDSMLIEKPLSPERGQLLLALVNSELDSLTYLNIYRDATFEQAYLEKVDLVRANLNGANLNLANLVNANLKEADMKKIYLNNANMTNANLSNTDLINASLNQAILNNANLINTDLLSSDLSQAYLLNAHLNNADLSNSDLTDAKLNNADLGNGIIHGVDFVNADLRNVNLTNTSLLDVDLTNANLTNVRVHRIDWIRKLEDWKIYGRDSLKKNMTIDTILRNSKDNIYHYYLLKPKN